MRASGNDYIPALNYRWLTPAYDLFMRLTMRESVFKPHLVRVARIAPHHRVLDLGCGTATLTMLIKQAHPEAEVVGLDGDSKILRVARAKIAKAGLDIKLNHGMAFTLPYPDGSFDRVLSSLVLHHLTTENRARALREVHRILRADGEVHVADFGKPHTTVMHAVSLAMRRLEQTADLIDGLLPRMLRDAGFQQIEEPARYSTLFGTLSFHSARKSE